MHALTYALITAVLLTPAGGPPEGKGKKKGDDVCGQTAALAHEAAEDQAEADALLGLAVCLNLTDAEEQAECLEEVWEGFAEAMELAGEQLEARLALCALLGPEAYDPEIDPQDFGGPIDNPYLPFPPGRSWLYHGLTDEGLEVVEVTVTNDTREIMGVDCTVVRDTVTIGGELLEDTRDYYAQDGEGNVWYFGELSFEYEDGEINALTGSWIAGEDGARPGIVMFADPAAEVGSTYRQEWLLGEAEDAGTVLGVGATVTVPYGTFDDCVHTRDFTPLEPDAEEEKFYAAGIGFIKEVKPGSGETVELVAFTP
jgi:hypothetical protein